MINSKKRGITTQNPALGNATKFTSAADSVVAITPSNSVKLESEAIGLWIGTGGNVVVTMPDGTTATLKNVPSGTRLNVSPMYVNAGTTASDIVALYS